MSYQSDRDRRLADEERRKRLGTVNQDDVTLAYNNFQQSSDTTDSSTTCD